MIRRRTALGALAAAAAAPLLSGCASGTPVDPRDDRYSVLYGYIDGSDAKIDWVQVKQYGSEPGYYLVDFDRNTGVFFHLGIEPGDLQVNKFGNDSAEYNWASHGRNPTAITVTRPGTYFVGSYKWIRHDKGLFRADEFEMQRTPTPSEAEVLALVLRKMESDSELTDYTHQRALVQKRLAALGGRRA
jgi:hypothetical protein